MVLDGPVKHRSPTETGCSDPSADEVAPPEPGSAGWWADRAAAEARRRPRAGGLTTTRIVEAALEILREDGLEALTVRAVAERFHTGNASLYRHIASRDELIALISDHVMGDVRLDRTGEGWRADTEALMREMRRVILDQPLPPSARRSTWAYGPNTLRVIDAALGLFLEAGLTDEQAACTTITMIKFIAGSADIQRSAAGRGPSGATGAEGFGRLLDGLPADQFTALRAAGHAYIAASADDVFDHGMAVFLDGVTHQLPAGG
jgi:AcrR family transcriptional regulator